MKTAILILVLTMGACVAAEPPRERTAVSNLCTADDPDCGPAGSNPEAARAATSDWVATNYTGARIISLSCTTDGAGEYDCHVSFSLLSFTYSFGCVFDSQTIDCGED